MTERYLPDLPSDVALERVTLPDGIALRIARAGSGRPLVLVPGWTIPLEVFVHQLTGLSDTFEVIAVDPRGHGGSDKPLTGNSFTQRGADLAALLEALDLTDVVLGGWSFGILDVLSALRDHDHARVSAVLLIDEPPKVVSDPANPAEWGEGPLSHDGLPAMIRMVSTDRAGFWTWVATHSLGLEVADAHTHPDAVRLIELGMQTPEHVAVITAAEGLSSDLSETAIEVARRLPVLFLARDEWADDARRWVEANLPSAEFDTLRTHAGFATQPDEFNDRVRAFLAH